MATRHRPAGYTGAGLAQDALEEGEDLFRITRCGGSAGRRSLVDGLERCRLGLLRGVRGGGNLELRQHAGLDKETIGLVEQRLQSLQHKLVESPQQQGLLGGIGVQGRDTLLERRNHTVRIQRHGALGDLDPGEHMGIAPLEQAERRGQLQPGARHHGVRRHGKIHVLGGDQAEGGEINVAGAGARLRLEGVEALGEPTPEGRLEVAAMAAQGLDKVQVGLLLGLSLALAPLLEQGRQAVEHTRQQGFQLRLHARAHGAHRSRLLRGRHDRTG